MKAYLIAILAVTAGLAGCAQDKDSDGDGLYDGSEKAGWTVRVDTMSQHLEYVAKPNKDKVDTDGDGLTDLEEFIQIPATDPTKRDTDGDGLTDCQETFHTNVSQCEDPTYSGPFDGGYPTNPTWADSDAGYSILVNEIRGFTDKDGNPYEVQHGDGISDYDEIMGYEVRFNGRKEIVTTVPTHSDWDEDGLPDGAELYFGSHPKMKDTDGDKCEDGFDADPAKASQYQLGLKTIDLKRGHDPLGGADLQIFALFHGQQYWLPDSGSVRIDNGINDISQLNEMITIDCEANPTPFTPWNPTVVLQFLAFDVDGSEKESIDMESGLPLVEWNMETGSIVMNGESIKNGQTAHYGSGNATLAFSPLIFNQ